MNAKHMNTRIGRIACWSLLICLLLGCLAACNKAEPLLGDVYDAQTPLKDVYNTKQKYETDPLQSFSLLLALDDMEVQDTSGPLVLLASKNSRETVFKVYHVLREEVVLNQTFANGNVEKDAVTLASGHIVTHTGGMYDLFDQTGKRLNQQASDVFSTCLNLIQLGETVYHVDTETYTVDDSFDWPIYRGPIPTFDENVGEYYYRTLDDTILVYNQHCELLCSYRVPSWASNRAWRHITLANGVVLFQFTETVNDAETTAYDVIMNGNKHRLYTLLFNPANQEITTLNADYVLIDDTVERLPAFRKDTSIYAEGVKNLVTVHLIRDRHIVRSNTLYSLNNDGTLGVAVENIMPGQRGAAVNLENGYFVAMAADNTVHLMDANGKLKGILSNSIDMVNRCMLTIQGKIYTFDMTQVKADVGGYNVIDATSEMLFFQKNGYPNATVSVSADGRMTQVSDGVRTQFIGAMSMANGLDVYVTSVTGVSNVQYSLYNRSGTLIFEGLGNLPKLVCQYGDKTLCSCQENDILRYYLAK